MTAITALRAQQGPKSKSQFRFDTDSKAIRVDNCASYSLSPDKKDFVSPLKRVNKRIQGIGGNLDDLYVGTIQWNIEDDNGRPQAILLPNSIYVPTSPSRLLSPQHWAQTTEGPNRPWCVTTHNEVTLHWEGTRVKTMPLDKSTGNVATMYTVPDYTAYQTFVERCGESEDLSIEGFVGNVVSDSEDEENDPAWERPRDNTNVEDLATKRQNEPIVEDWSTTTPVEFDLNGPNAGDHEEIPVIQTQEEDEPERESNQAMFLQWHHRLNHLSPATMQHMAKQGLLPSKLAKCQTPACSSCLYGKATRRPWRTKPAAKASVSKLRTATAPGQCISIDQLESRTPGLIAQMRGWITKKRYRVATIFVDHFSGHSYVYLQKTTNSEETVEAKVAYERFLSRLGIKVQSYQADNGRFADAPFMQAIRQAGQTITFCGVNAHFQNGVAERKIRSLQDQARTMLIHAQHRWPQAIDAHLWPYAIRAANDVQNATPIRKRIDNKSPIELLTNSEVRPNLTMFKTFGCPVFVLDNRMQAGQKLPKWDLRARMGVNLGLSNQHAKSVTLVLSLQTGHVSPQFHVKWDNKFETVRKSLGNESPPSKWQEECSFKARTNRASQRLEQKRKLQREEDLKDVEGEEPMAGQDPNEEAAQTESTEQPRRSARIRGQPRPNYAEPDLKKRYDWAAMEATIEQTLQYHVAFEAVKEWLEEEQHFAFAASKDPDTMYYHEAMKEPDKKEFLKAMEKEVQSHTDNGVWELVRKEDVPNNQKILPAVWAMKRKRRIATREVYKWKARLNIDGSKQEEGINYWETFSPVASWSTIRLMLVLILIKGWETRQIDFVLAYTQADVECEMYMAIPKGFEVDGDGEYALKLVKNLFGQKQAGRVWNIHLVDKLKGIGFRQSEIDECLFYKGACIFVLYTDDSILAGPNAEELDHIIQQMMDIGLDLTVEKGIEDFLGVQIERINGGKSFKLSQPHLIKDILAELHLDPLKTKPKRTSGSSSKPLLRCLQSEAFDGHFDYRRVIGKLNYLEKCTRPDISCATHQCARFVSQPKEEHGKAVKWIGRYLVGTMDEGLLITPDEDGDFEVFVDASFVGDWDVKDAEWDESTARSRMGYVIMYAKCPVIWASKVQTEIALSTTESEYLAISAATREVLPMMELLQELQQEGLTNKVKPTIHCKVFEDNSGAIEVATSVKNPKMRPRTKHINTKYHHFRQHVQKGKISIRPVKTEDMLADILTKIVNEETLMRLKPRIMGSAIAPDYVERERE